MKCPRDGSALEAQQYEATIEVDACGKCGGLWLDDGELEAIQKSTERDYSSELRRMPEILRGDAHRPHPTDAAACPRCAQPLASREYAHCSQITIDGCPGGCGVWVDKGELEAIEVFFERSRKEAKADDSDPIWIARGFWASLTGMFRRKPA